jgi:integrase
VSPANKWHRLGATPDEAHATYAKIATLPFQPGTVGHTIDRYIREVLPLKSKRTQSDYLDAARYIKAAFGTMAAKKLDRKDISDYLTKRGARVRANREIAFLSTVMTHAMSWGVVIANPCSRVKRNEEKGRDRYIEDDEYKVVMELANGTVKDVAKIGYVTSQRISDVLKIRLEDVRDNGIFVKQGKTNARLLIRISGETLQMVQRRKASSKEYLFEHHGKPYTYDGYASMYKRVVKKALVRGLIKESFTIHDLRAKALTDADLVGMDAQKLAGHATRKQTEEYIKRRRTVEVDSLEAL